MQYIYFTALPHSHAEVCKKKKRDYLHVSWTLADDDDNSILNFNYKRRK